jgi:hypothetical protein
LQKTYHVFKRKAFLNKNNPLVRNAVWFWRNSLKVN